MKKVRTALTRRGFLGGCAALGTLAGCRSLGLGGASAPMLRLGVVSDIHLDVPGDEKSFIAALEYFRSVGVDGVLMAGDMANLGRIEQMERGAAAWYGVFPDGKYPDGRRCEQLFIYGNHCIDFANNDPEGGIGYGENRRLVWERLFHEEYQPIWLKRVRGVPVIGAHWVNWSGTGGALTRFFDSHGGELDADTPFVFTQHAHPKDTCFGTWAWGHDDGESTAVLSRFPNAVAFTGHSHYTLTDERSVWQGAFTSINAGSMKYSSTDYSLRENMPGNSQGFRAENRQHVMPRMKTDDGRQGMVVDFFEDRLEIDRREFVYGKSLGPKWTVPMMALRRDFSYSARAARRSAPRFAADAAVTVRAVTADGRRTVEVGFPAAAAVDGSRPFEYEITATLVEDDVELVLAQRRVMDRRFHLPEGVGMTRPDTVRFDFTELKAAGRCRFEVRPLECFGLKGAAIVSEAVDLAALAKG